MLRCVSTVCSKFAIASIKSLDLADSVLRRFICSSYMRRNLCSRSSYMRRISCSRVSYVRRSVRSRSRCWLIMSKTSDLQEVPMSFRLTRRKKYKQQQMVGAINPYTTCNTNHGMCLSNDRCAKFSLKGDKSSCLHNGCSYDTSTDLCYTDCASRSKSQCSNNTGVICRWDDDIDQCYAAGSYCGVADDNSMKCMRPDEQLMRATLTEDTTDSEVRVTIAGPDRSYFAHLDTSDDGGVTSWLQHDASDFTLNLCRVDADCSTKRGIIGNCASNCSFFDHDCGGLFESANTGCDCGLGLARGNDSCLPGDFATTGTHDISVRDCGRQTQALCNSSYGFLGRKCKWLGTHCGRASTEGTV